MASATVGKLNVLISGSNKGLDSAMKDSEKKVGSFGGSISSALSSATSLITSGVSSFAAFTMSSIDSIGALHDQATALGVTTDKLAALQFAASLSGVEAEAFNASMGKMEKTLADAANGDGSDVFSKMGLDAKALVGQSPDQAFKQIADAVSKIENPYQRAQAAVEVFGKSGKQMIPVLQEGSAGLDAMQNQAQKMGLAVSQVDAESVDRAGDSLDTAEKLLTGVGNTVATFLAPIIEDLTNKFIGTATEGEGVGPKVTAAMEWVASGVAYAADYLELFKAGWGFLKIGAIGAVAGILKAIDLAGAGLVKLANLLPGVNIEWTTTFSAMADSMVTDVSAAMDDVDKSMKRFNDGANSKAVGKYFDEVRAKGKAASEDAVKNGTQNDAAFKAAEKNAADSKKAKDKLAKQEKKRLDEQKKAQEDAARESIKWDEEAMKVKEEMMTPIQKQKAELLKLQTLFDSGRLTEAEFDKAATGVLGKGNKAQGDAPKLFKAGTNEAFNVIASIQGRALSGDKGVSKEQLAEAKKQTDWMAKQYALAAQQATNLVVSI